MQKGVWSGSIVLPKRTHYNININKCDDPLVPPAVPISTISPSPTPSPPSHSASTSPSNSASPSPRFPTSSDSPASSPRSLTTTTTSADTTIVSNNEEKLPSNSIPCETKGLPPDPQRSEDFNNDIEIVKDNNDIRIFSNINTTANTTDTTNASHVNTASTYVNTANTSPIQTNPNSSNDDNDNNSTCNSSSSCSNNDNDNNNSSSSTNNSNTNHPHNIQNKFEYLDLMYKYVAVARSNNEVHQQSACYRVKLVVCDACNTIYLDDNWCEVCLRVLIVTHSYSVLFRTPTSLQRSLLCCTYCLR